MNTAAREGNQGCSTSINHDARWQRVLPDPEWSVSRREVEPSMER